MQVNIPAIHRCYGLYSYSCQPRVQHGRNAPPCTACGSRQGIITHTFQLSQIQKAFIVATEHPGCQTKKHEGEFLLSSASFYTWILPFNVVRFFFSAVFFSPTFKIKTHIFWGAELVSKPYLKDPSLFFFMSSQVFFIVFSMYFVATV